MAWRWVLAAILATLSLSLLGSAYDEFTSDTLINNVVQDPITSRLYVGTVNALYQLDQSLHPEAHTRTGPELDNRQCTPPVTSCEEAVETDNHNKLLLIHPSKDTLIVCGSLYRGICSLRNLSNVEQLLYFSDTKGEKSYVASAEEGVSVVGVMSYYFNKDKGNFTVFLVGGRTAPIIEASAVQSNPFTLRYLHDFRHVFKDEGFVYFLFSRTLGAQDSGTKNFTFISRMCENDHNYYSYTELQLNCSAGNKYNKVQAAYVTLPGEALAKNMSSSGWYGPVGAQDKKGMVTNQKCGAEFLPSPLASRAEFALATDPVFTKKGLMTAVAVAVETENAVAFLGTTLGEVLITKVPVQACHLKTDCQSCVAQKDPYCGWCVLQGKCTRKGDCPRAEDDNTWLWSPNQQCVQIQAFNPPNLSCRKTDYLLFSLQADSCPQFENPDPHLIPVGYLIPIMVLYNCSLGREDCSLCKNADPKYSCVWCANMRSCVYRELCQSQEPAQCPNPKITEIIPRFGPLNGGIVVTIKGSNLGIKKEDIKKVTVAGVDCVHQGDRYSVSTRYSDSPINQGVVEVEVEGDRRGRSEVLFTYRDPIPEKVSPLKGPVAGGTVITISGKHLDTANKNDVIVTVGGTPCELYVFVCDYRLLCETRHSVLPGIKYLSLSLYSNFLCPLLQFIQYAVHKNDTVLLFDSPVVNRSSETQSFRAFLQLDNVIEELNSFEYHPDPFFNELTKNIITETSIIIVTGRGFSKAMTAEEAQAFVGDASCKVTILQDDKLFLEAPSTQPRARSKRQRRDTSSDPLDLTIKFGNGEWVVGSVNYERKYEVPLAIIIPAVIVPMLLFIAVSVYCYRRKSQQAEREYEKVKHQLDHLEESVRDRCKKEFTDLMIEMEDQTNDLSEARIPFLDYKTYTDRVFFLPSKDGDNDVMITGKLDIPEGRKVIVAQALNQFSNLLNSKTFLINFIKTLEGRPDFNARSRVYFASLLTVALHGKLEYYTDIMRSLLLELMEEYVHSKNPKLMLRRSETVVERMLCNWMSICLYQFLRDSAGEPLYKLFKAIKHQVEKGPVDAKMKKAKYTLNDTGLLGDDVEYCVLTLQVLVHGEGPDVTPVKVLNCDTISQVKEKIIEQVYRNLPYSQRPKVDSVALEWRPGSTGQILSDMDLTSQKEGRWKRLNTLAHYNETKKKNALLEDDKVFHLVRPADELDEVKSKRGSLKAKATTKAIAEIYLTRLLSVKGTLQQFVDDFFRSVLCSGAVVPPAVKYFFDFLDEQALKHDNVEEETVHIWKTNSLPMRFWVNILKNPHFIFDVHVTEVVDASLSVIAQTFMDACTKTEHKLSRESPSNKLLYAKEISTYKKMVDDYYKGIKQMVPVSDQDMNTHLAEVSREHTDTLNTQAALHQLYQYASKYYDGIIQSLDEDPAAQSKQLTLRLQQIAAALENKVTDL
uniref:Sema domain-containing protein n=1 Tax=Oncorhynchus tshawytscha TaxID=74940 RepID=A0AAZ3SG31_ONCTS